MTFSIKIIHHLISETQVCKCKQTDISSQADSKGKVESRGIKECIRSKKKKKSVYAACQVYLLQTNSDIVQMFLVQFEKFQKKLRE